MREAPPTGLIATSFLFSLYRRKPVSTAAAGPCILPDRGIVDLANFRSASATDPSNSTSIVAAFFLAGWLLALLAGCAADNGSAHSGNSKNGGFYGGLSGGAVQP